MARRLFRRGFTLIELLVVIAIIAILIALLLPAVQQAREAARRTQCRNNMHNIALALHNYHDAHKFFPPGVVRGSPSWGYKSNTETSTWTMMILPYIEQAQMYNQMNWNTTNWYPGTIFTVPNCTLSQMPLAVYQCPSDPFKDGLWRSSGWICLGGTDVNGFAPANYAAYADSRNKVDPNNTFSCATCMPRTDGNGMFFNRSKIELARVLDGSSNTLMLGEVSGGAGDSQGWEWGWGGMLLDTRITPNGPGTWVGDGTFLNPRETFTSQGASSHHEGGIHVGMGDGSVRFISENIDYLTYTRLATRHGREVAGEF